MILACLCCSQDFYPCAALTDWQQDADSHHDQQQRQPERHQYDPLGYLKRILVGKAAQEIEDSENALASMNCWSFDQRIFDACRKVPISVRNEFELPQAVQLAIDTMDMKIRVIPVDAGVLDLSSRGDIAAVAQRLSEVEVSL